MRAPLRRAGLLRKEGFCEEALLVLNVVKACQTACAYNKGEKLYTLLLRFLGRSPILRFSFTERK
jgi:hypothetical protein